MSKVTDLIDRPQRHTEARGKHFCMTSLSNPTHVSPYCMALSGKTGHALRLIGYTALLACLAI